MAKKILLICIVFVVLLSGCGYKGKPIDQDDNFEQSKLISTGTVMDSEKVEIADIGALVKNLEAEYAQEGKVLELLDYVDQSLYFAIKTIVSDHLQHHEKIYKYSMIESKTSLVFEFDKNYTLTNFMHTNDGDYVSGEFNSNVDSDTIRSYRIAWIRDEKSVLASQGALFKNQQAPSLEYDGSNVYFVGQKYQEDGQYTFGLYQMFRGQTLEVQSYTSYQSTSDLHENRAERPDLHSLVIADGVFMYTSGYMRDAVSGPVQYLNMTDQKIDITYPDGSFWPLMGNNVNYVMSSSTEWMLFRNDTLMNVKNESLIKDYFGHTLYTGNSKYLVYQGYNQSVLDPSIYQVEFVVDTFFVEQYPIEFEPDDLWGYPLGRSSQDFIYIVYNSQLEGYRFLHIKTKA